ncbi:hypothetical protein JCM4814A_59410 [Streptomyces phaeofaciens JCM 4814]|uniref:Uncharacterized protein n=1 Tax=Streptomyces phaeofaciens TaxID=68254 RepID=A0A918HQY3_9ACTN|nr:hypothetical protein GCM10010226_89000 [Streptomyces phaeofaciens]
MTTITRSLVTSRTRSIGLAVPTVGNPYVARAELFSPRLAAPDHPARTVRPPCAFVHRTYCGCPTGPLRVRQSPLPRRP